MGSCCHAACQENQSQPLLTPTSPTPEPEASHGSGTGDCPDMSPEEIQQLIEEVKKLRIDNNSLTQERDRLNVELLNMKAAETGGLEETPQEPNDAPNVSDEAARKRLQRLCQRKTDGSLRYQPYVYFWFVFLGLTHSPKRFFHEHPNGLLNLRGFIRLGRYRCLSPFTKNGKRAARTEMPC